MILGDGERNLAALAVPRIGGLRETRDPWEPYRLHDAEGAVVGPVSAFLKDLQAAARPAATQRSYAMDLLRWFRPVGRSACRGTGDEGRGPRLATINWAAAITALNDGELPCSSGEQRILRLAASLAGGIPVSLSDTVTGLDHANTRHLITAIYLASSLSSPFRSKQQILKFDLFDRSDSSI
jgi:hypothetical protein